MIASPCTCLTTGSTHGFALSSRYAPIPKSIFFESVSRRYAAIKPKSGSSGAWGQTSWVNEVAEVPLLMEPIWPEICCSRLLAVVLGMALVLEVVVEEGMLSREILEIVGSATAVAKRGRLLKQEDALLLLQSLGYITETTVRRCRGRCLAPTFYRFHDLTSLAHLAHMNEASRGILAVPGRSSRACSH